MKHDKAAGKTKWYVRVPVSSMAKTTGVRGNRKHEAKRPTIPAQVDSHYICKPRSRTVAKLDFVHF